MFSLTTLNIIPLRSHLSQRYKHQILHIHSAYYMIHIRTFTSLEREYNSLLPDDTNHLLYYTILDASSHA